MSNFLSNPNVRRGLAVLTTAGALYAGTIACSGDQPQSKPVPEQLVRGPIDGSPQSTFPEQTIPSDITPVDKKYLESPERNFLMQAAANNLGAKVVDAHKNGRVQLTFAPDTEGQKSGWVTLGSPYTVRPDSNVVVNIRVFRGENGEIDLDQGVRGIYVTQFASENVIASQIKLSAPGNQDYDACDQSIEGWHTTVRHQRINSTITDTLGDTCLTGEITNPLTFQELDVQAVNQATYLLATNNIG